MKIVVCIKQVPDTNEVKLDPVTNTRQQISIKPISLGEESGLLYRRWVKMNEAEVDKLSNGQLGYVHIPGMGAGRGW